MARFFSQSQLTAQQNACKNTYKKAYFGLQKTKLSILEYYISYAALLDEYKLH